MKLKILSGNTLKIFAAIFMLVDHIGFVIFPEHVILRIIGRLSFPIFAFMIVEGCWYTKNKLRYFLGIFALATVCQIVYFLYDKSMYMSALVTLSISILLVYLFLFLKHKFFSVESNYYKKFSAVLIFFAAVAVVYILNMHLEIDYGFYGCIAPVFACALKNIGTLNLQITLYAIGLLLLSVSMGGIQFYCLLALPLLFLYSGKRGKVNMKLFFYIFYPAHLLAVQFVNILIS